MTLSKRQEKILNALIQEYTKTAEPVSSKLLSKKKGFSVCPATIRNELQELTDMGYIYQPHTSAGRAPTSKAYRYFVDNLFNLSAPSLFNSFFDGDFDFFSSQDQTELKFFESLTKNLARSSAGLVMTYLPESDCMLKEGWEDLFSNPEFKEKSYIDRFIEEVESIEKNIKRIAENSDGKSVNVYIGGEKPIPDSEDFSLIISKSKFPNRQEGIVAIFGPARMEYEKNIGLLQSLIKFLE